MATRQSFRVVGGRDYSSAEKATLAEARKRARPLHRYWLRKVELAIVAGRLQPCDFLLAKELTNYPSANEGRAYPGLRRLAEKMGCVERTVSRSLDRLTTEGLLKSKRRGPGKTADRLMCFKGVEIFGVGAAQHATESNQDQTQVSNLDWTDVSTKPLEEHPLEAKPPPTPTTTADDDARPDGRPKEDNCQDAIDGGMPFAGMLSFSEFWIAVGRRGAEGFARSEWRKLSSADHLTIGDKLARDGRLSIGSMYAGTWLRDRVWEEAGPRVERPADGDGRNASAGNNLSVLWPETPAFAAERDRRQSRGDHQFVGIMDRAAARGAPVTVET